MNKHDEIKALAEKYGMEILRNPITNEAWGLRLETKEDIPELDSIASDITPHQVSVTKEYGAYYEANGTHIYTVTCPTSWFDKFGWVK